MRWDGTLTRPGADRPRTQACVWKLVRCISAHSRVAKKLSAIALSKQFATEPIEGRPGRQVVYGSSRRRRFGPDSPS